MLEAFFDMSLGVQTSIGFGYMAYMTAYTGQRRHHVTSDSIFISLAFGSIAFLLFYLLQEQGAFLAFIAAAGAALLAGVIWRWFGRKLAMKILHKIRVHQDDGLYFGWDELIQNIGDVDQASVHTTDGRILYLVNRRKYADAPYKGLYLGGDGSITMIVEEEQRRDGKLEGREGIYADGWGYRLTHIPVAQIAQVDVRVG